MRLDCLCLRPRARGRPPPPLAPIATARSGSRSWDSALERSWGASSPAAEPSRIAFGDPARPPLRVGSWTAAEEAYAEAVSTLFVNGRLPNCHECTTLRALLADLLQCAPRCTAGVRRSFLPGPSPPVGAVHARRARGGEGRGGGPIGLAPPPRSRCRGVEGSRCRGVEGSRVRARPRADSDRVNPQRRISKKLSGRLVGGKRSYRHACGSDGLAVARETARARCPPTFRGAGAARA